MSTDLLETLEVLADLAVENVGHNLRVLAILDVVLPVEHPVRDLVLARVRHDRNHLLDLADKKKIYILVYKYKTPRHSSQCPLVERGGSISYWRGGEEKSQTYSNCNLEYL